VPEYDFVGQNVFVTGAARGLGRSHARRFAKAGADLVLADSCTPEAGEQYLLASRADLDETASMVETTGSEALVLELDVREKEAVERAVSRATTELDGIDVLVNNAGVWSVAATSEMTESTFDRVVETDLKGTWLCSKYVGRHMRGREAKAREDAGAIVNTASVAGHVGTRNSSHYAAAKHGVVGLTKSMALELAEYAVTVNAVCPTGADTPLVEGIVESQGESTLEQVSDLSGSMNLLDEQLLSPDAVSEAVLWLASDATRYVTGASLPVDAGMLAK